MSTTPSTKKLTSGDCDDDRQPETAIYTFWVSIFDHCCHHKNKWMNHLANLLSSSVIIENPEFDVWISRLYLSEEQRRNYFRFCGHIDISRCRSLLYLLANTILHLYMDLPQICRWNFNCTFHSLRDISISGFGRHFRLLLIIGIA